MAGRRSRFRSAAYPRSCSRSRRQTSPRCSTAPCIYGRPGYASMCEARLVLATSIFKLCAAPCSHTRGPVLASGVLRPSLQEWQFVDHVRCQGPEAERHQILREPASPCHHRRTSSSNGKGSECRPRCVGGPWAVWAGEGAWERPVWERVAGKVAGRGCGRQGAALHVRCQVQRGDGQGESPVQSSFSGCAACWKAGLGP